MAAFVAWLGYTECPSHCSVGQLSGALGHRYSMRSGKGAPRREASKAQLVGIVRESIDRLVSSNPYVTAADVARVLKADCGCFQHMH